MIDGGRRIECFRYLACMQRRNWKQARGRRLPSLHGRRPLRSTTTVVVLPSGIQRGVQGVECSLGGKSLRCQIWNTAGARPMGVGGRPGVAGMGWTQIVVTVVSERAKLKRDGGMMLRWGQPHGFLTRALTDWGNFFFLGWSRRDGGG